MTVCLKITYDPAKDGELFPLLLNPVPAAGNQRYWLYHAICGDIAYDFPDKFIVRAIDTTKNSVRVRTPFKF